MLVKWHIVSTHAREWWSTGEEYIYETMIAMTRKTMRVLCIVMVAPYRVYSCPTSSVWIQCQICFSAAPGVPFLPPCLGCVFGLL